MQSQRLDVKQQKNRNMPVTRAWFVCGTGQYLYLNEFSWTPVISSSFESELFISGDVIREKSQENHETGMEDTYLFN
jgi:hypothetical protein